MMCVRLFGRLVLSALVFTALVAVVTLLFGELDDPEWKILGTSASVAAYGLLAMAGAAGLEGRRARLLKLAGGITILLAMTGFAIITFNIWFERHRSEWLPKTWAVASVSAAAFALVVLVVRIELPAAQRWMQTTTASLILLLMILIDVPVIIYEKSFDAMSRGLGALGVLVALGILSIPVVAWQSRSTAARSSGEYRNVGLTCPRCGEERLADVGRSRCSQCDLEIKIEVFTP